MHNKLAKNCPQSCFRPVFDFNHKKEESDEEMVQKEDELDEDTDDIQEMLKSIEKIRQEIQDRLEAIRMNKKIINT